MFLLYLIHSTKSLNSSCQRKGNLSHMHSLISFDHILDHLLNSLQLLHSHRTLRKQISLQEKPPKRHRTKEGELWAHRQLSLDTPLSP